MDADGEMRSGLRQDMSDVELAALSEAAGQRAYGATGGGQILELYLMRLPKESTDSHGDDTRLLASRTGDSYLGRLLHGVSPYWKPDLVARLDVPKRAPIAASGDTMPNRPVVRVVDFSTPASIRACQQNYPYPRNDAGFVGSYGFRFGEADVTLELYEANSLAWRSAEHRLKELAVRIR